MNVNKKFEWLNKVLFLEKINHLKSEETRKYWSNILLVKNILIKFLIFLLVGIFVMGLSFIVRQIMIDHYPSTKIVPNTGVGFSIGANASDSKIVYLIQSIPCVITFLIFFFVTNKWIYIGLFVIFFGGLSNIIDRALPLHIIVDGELFPSNAVVDYIKLFNTNTTCNLPDIFITIGAIYTILILIVTIFITWKKERQTPSTPTKEQVKKPESTHQLN